MIELINFGEQMVLGQIWTWTSHESGPGDVGDPTPPDSRTVTVYGPDSVTLDA